MGTYRTRQVCLNGHDREDRVDRSPERGEQFCSICGVETITECPKCNASIRGVYDVPSRSVDGMFLMGHYETTQVPNHCHNCGGAFPWMERHADALAEAIDELDELSDDEREKLKKSIPDIVADSPKADVAGTRFKKAVAKVGNEGGKLLMKILQDVATDAVKSAMGRG